MAIILHITNYYFVSIYGRVSPKCGNINIDISLKFFIDNFIYYYLSRRKFIQIEINEKLHKKHYAFEKTVKFSLGINSTQIM